MVLAGMNRKKGLGVEFLDSVEVAIHTLFSFPELYVVCHANFRRCLDCQTRHRLTEKTDLRQCRLIIVVVY